MVPQILLPRLVANHHPESAVRVDINRFLYIQFVPRNHVFRHLCWIVFDHAEMHLLIHEPIVGYAVSLSVLLKQPDDIAVASAIEVLSSSVRHRSDIVLEGIPVIGQGRTVEPSEPGPTYRRTTGRPPKRIEAQAQSKPEKRSPKELALPKNMNPRLPKAEAARTHSSEMRTCSVWGCPTCTGRTRNRHARR